MRLGELVCAVSLHTAVSTSERVRLHMVNRQTGHRLSRHFVDPETGDVVERDAQVKGYEVADGDYVVLETDEIAEATPKGDKTLDIGNFLACDAIDDLYFDRAYYLRPSDKTSQPAFAVIREGLQERKVAALATAVLFRRPRNLIIRAHEDGLIATTLHYDYEVRSVAEAFEDLREVKIEPEMLDLARHIIETKSGRFEPETFEDRYDDALAELVRAKLAGRKIAPPKRQAEKVVSLMDALRESAEIAGKTSTSAAKKAGAAAPKSAKSKSTRSGKSAGRKTAPRPSARKAG